MMYIWTYVHICDLAPGNSNPNNEMGDLTKYGQDPIYFNKTKSGK